MRWWPFGKKTKQGRSSRRSYAGAATSRLLADFNLVNTSADAEIRASLPRLRNRLRELARNNDYVKGALRTIKTNVIGEGIPFQAQVKSLRGGKLDKKTNDRIEQAWDHWTCANRCDVSGKKHFPDIEGLVATSLPKSGEVLIRIHRQTFGDSKVPMALEVLSSDFLDDNYNVGRLDSGGSIRMGVEVDQWRRPVAYWLFDKNPGDLYGLAVSPTGKRIRVDAKDMIHLFIQEDEEQTRGVPWFHTAITRLHHMGGYEEAEIVAARVQACRMGFIQTPEGELQGDDVDDGQRVTDMEPGKIERLGEGESYVDVSPSRPGGQFDPFMKVMLRGVSAGIGISYELVSKDYSMSNYSSTRQSLLEDRANWRVLQRWMIRAFHQRVFEEFMDMAYLSGQLDLPLYATQPELYTYVKWMPRGWSWIDPLKEVEAAKASVRMGLSSLTKIAAEQGEDFEEIMQQRKQEMDLCKQLGIILESDPANDAMLGAQPQKKPGDGVTTTEAAAG